MRTRSGQFATAAQTFDVDTLMQELGLSGGRRQPRLAANDIFAMTADSGRQVRRLPAAA